MAFFSFSCFLIMPSLLLLPFLLLLSLRSTCLVKVVLHFLPPVLLWYYLCEILGHNLKKQETYKKASSREFPVASALLLSQISVRYSVNESEKWVLSTLTSDTSDSALILKVAATMYISTQVPALHLLEILCISERAELPSSLRFHLDHSQTSEVQMEQMETQTLVLATPTLKSAFRSSNSSST